MNLRLLLIGLALSLSCRAAEPPRISIPDLLNPATRMREFQRYCIAAEPKAAAERGWKDDRTFADVHAGLRVKTLQKSGAAARYGVTWSWLGNQWSESDFRELDAAVLTPRRQSSLLIFSADGIALGEARSCLNDSIIADLRGNSEMEVLEEDWISSAPGGGNRMINYLTVHPFDRPAEVSLALALNAHPASHAAGNTWGFQAVGPGADGTYEIQLGPVRGVSGIEPKVRFHWDKARGQWLGPAAQPGDHFCILKEEDREALATGSVALSYPLAPPPQPDAVPIDVLDFIWALEKRPPPAAAYVYRSLAGATDQALLTYFGQEKTGADVRADRLAAATSVPDFWETDPQQAALNYVRRNRPTEFENRYLLAPLHPEAAAPPEGDASLSIEGIGTGLGRSSAPGVYHVHCRREGSFLAMTSLLSDPALPSVLDAPPLPEARKLDLTYHDARQLFQAIWWMRQIRSRCLTHDPDSQPTVDHAPYGAVRLTAPGVDLTETGFVRSTYLGFVGVAEDGSYDPQAFLGVATKLLEVDALPRFGAAWTSLGPSAHPSTGSARQTAKSEAAAAGLLKLFNEGQLGPEAVCPVVIAAGWQGWQELRGELEKAEAGLAPPGDDERLLLQLLADVAAARVKRGDSDRCYLELARAQARIEPRIQDLAVLRQSLARALRQLALWNNAEALVAWSKQEPDALDFVVYRLAKTDPARARALLSDAVQAAGQRQPAYEIGQDMLAGGRAVPVEARADSESGRKALLQVLLDPRAGEPWRAEPLARLIPPEEPERYPGDDIDAALLELLRRERAPGEERPPDLALAAARRLDGKAWEALVQYANPMEALPALTLLAVKEPGRCRATMLDLVRPELTSSYGKLDEVLWCIWLLDLQELKPELERVATSGPEDYEGDLAKRQDKLSPADERFHLARQVAALWNEEDPLTRARLLIAFGIAHADRLADGRPAAMAHFTRQLEEAWRPLSPEQRTAVEKLVLWCEEHAYTQLQRPIERASFDAVVGATRKTIFP